MHQICVFAALSLIRSRSHHAGDEGLHLFQRNINVTSSAKLADATKVTPFFCAAASDGTAQTECSSSPGWRGTLEPEKADTNWSPTVRTACLMINGVRVVAQADPPPNNHVCPRYSGSSAPRTSVNPRDRRSSCAPGVPPPNTQEDSEVRPLADDDAATAASSFGSRRDRSEACR